MNLGWEPGNENQNNVVCISVSRDISSQNHIKRNAKIIVFKLRYGKMLSKCEFWRDQYCKCSTGKMQDFDYCEEYLKSISNKILLWWC